MAVVTTPTTAIGVAIVVAEAATVVTVGGCLVGSALVTTECTNPTKLGVHRVVTESLLALLALLTLGKTGLGLSLPGNAVGSGSGAVREGGTGATGFGVKSLRFISGSRGLSGDGRVWTEATLGAEYIGHGSAEGVGTGSDVVGLSRASAAVDRLTGEAASVGGGRGSLVIGESSSGRLGSVHALAVGILVVVTVLLLVLLVLWVLHVFFIATSVIVHRAGAAVVLLLVLVHLVHVRSVVGVVIVVVISIAIAVLRSVGSRGNYRASGIRRTVTTVGVINVTIAAGWLGGRNLSLSLSTGDAKSNSRAGAGGGILGLTVGAVGVVVGVEGRVLAASGSRLNRSLVGKRLGNLLLGLADLLGERIKGLLLGLGIPEVGK